MLKSNSGLPALLDLSYNSSLYVQKNCKYVHILFKERRKLESEDREELSLAVSVQNNINLGRMGFLCSHIVHRDEVI